MIKIDSEFEFVVQRGYVSHNQYRLFLDWSWNVGCHVNFDLTCTAIIQCYLLQRDWHLCLDVDNKNAKKREDCLRRLLNLVCLHEQWSIRMWMPYRWACRQVHAGEELIVGAGNVRVCQRTSGQTGKRRTAVYSLPETGQAIVFGCKRQQIGMSNIPHRPTSMWHREPATLVHLVDLPVLLVVLLGWISNSSSWCWW